MLFAVKYSPGIGRSAADRPRASHVVMAWSPPGSVDLRAHYRLPGGAGILLVETESAIDLYESLEPFKPIVQLELKPVLNRIDAEPAKTDAWLPSESAGA